MTHCWHFGPPPKPGWWEASSTLDETRIWRWWNGSFWSFGYNSLETPPFHDLHEAPGQDFILWTEYYPKNARVAR